MFTTSPWCWGLKARAGLDRIDLQRPLVHMTWIWREGSDAALQASHSALCVLQVPSLFLEAQLGLPVRVVIDSKESLETFDKERFLSALAVAIGVPAERLVIQRLSHGSIIVDVDLGSSTLLELASLTRRCPSLVKLY